MTDKEKQELEQQENGAAEEAAGIPGDQEAEAAGQEPEAEEDFSPSEAGPDQLRKELNALNDRYLRLMAEYDNYRKRSARERDDIYPNATASALEKFLPILDTFERAAEFDRGTEEFSKGFDMLLQNFRDVIAGFGVEPVGEVGEPFNPDLHNAVMHIEDESLGENVVSQVLQKGYKIGNRVLRYAMVQTAN